MVPAFAVRWSIKSLWGRGMLARREELFVLAWSAEPDFPPLLLKPLHTLAAPTKTT